MEDEEASQPSRTRARHIKKRALKNKALSVSFDEKDLRDYVTGFHKRKKKRRKEAQEKLEEAGRRKRIDARKKRKLEREYVQYGGAPTDTGAEPDECGEQCEQDEESELIPSVSGTTMYDSGDVKVTVTTREISREEESPDERSQAPAAPISVGGAEKKKLNVQVSKKKLIKKVSKNRSRSKTLNKRDKKKGNKENKKR